MTPNRLPLGVEGRFRTIVADPPWPYETSKTGRFVIPKGRSKLWSRGVEQMGYSVMDIEELCRLDVEGASEPDAHLYLWTTNAFLAEAHRVARSWGFAPKTVLTWVKVTNKDRAKPSMRTGYYFRGATEHIVFAVRGRLRLKNTTEGLPTAYLWVRQGGHSVKPGAFYDLVEKASPGPYLELFARQQRLGWSSWGHGYEAA